MSSWQPPPDCALQLPSWDEFDQTEELDYSESDRESDDHTTQRSSTIGPSLPAGLDAGPSRMRETEERSSVPPDVRHSSHASSSFSEQLPNSLSQNDDSEPSSSQHSQPLGPALPPGFVLNECNDGDDPEDPGDPEDPDESDSRSKVPTFHCSEGASLPRFSSATSSSGGARVIGPSIPPGFGDFSPTLPDDEIRPGSQSGRGGSSSAMPPPEPEETRVTSWLSSKQDPVVTGSRRLIGPAVPDLLPTVSQLENTEEDEDDEEEVYGPTVPLDLAPTETASTSDARDIDLEMPVDDDEHCARPDDALDGSEVVGPTPPCENTDVVRREYEQRLSAYRARQSDKEPTVKRDEWMLKLPKKLHSFGLGARTFSKTNNGDVTEEERNAWTKVPNKDGSDMPGPSSEKKQEGPQRSERDVAQEQCAQQLNEGRNEAMIDIHQRKRKRQSDPDESEGASTSGRVAFDRERDMHVKGLRGGMGVAEVKERCGQLSSRFGHSSSQKFL